MTVHPGWLLALVADVEQYEDLHAAPPGVESWACFGRALGGVPAEVRDQARGWAQAKRDAATDVVPPAGEAVAAEAVTAPTFDLGPVSEPGLPVPCDECETTGQNCRAHRITTAAEPIPADEAV